jgi:hypothetical protein
MMLSTLEEYFKGNHELFRGLAADQLEPPESEGGWKEHIVFHFDFASGVFQNNGINELHDNINNTFSDVVRKHNLELPQIHSLTTKFQNLIDQAAEKSGLPVVILFDEYDQPLNQNLMDYDKLQPLRNEMRAFFSILKTASENIRFAMLTGVTKFSGVTLFSGVNQLFDISMSQQYADICGITQNELEVNFPQELSRLAKAQQLSCTDTLEIVQKKYDGYDFAGGGTKVYNPFSTIRVLAEKEFNNYWFSSGTPSFLIDLIQTKHFDIAPIFDNQISLSKNQLENFATEKPSLIPLLYQTGYLTIKDFDEGEFDLGFPNQEVEYGFVNSLIERLTQSDTLVDSSFDALISNIRKGNINEFVQRLTAIFSKIPYDLDNKTEKHFQTLFWFLLDLIGMQIAVEVHSAYGSADAIISTKKFTYIFELKVKTEGQDGEKLAETALQQIEDQGYAKPFKQNPDEKRKIIKVGLVFDSETRTVSDYKIS